MSQEETTEEPSVARLQALEERVAALEHRVAPVGKASQDAATAVKSGKMMATAATDADDAFWVLNGLKRRIPDPGAVVFAGAVTGEGNRHYEFQYGLTTDAVLDLDWSGFAGSLSALGHPVRLRILHGVLQGTETVAGLAEELDAGTTGQLYHHVNQLVSQGWLAASVRGRFQVPAGRVVPLLAILTAAGV